jgi:hypothetical protein
VSLEIVENLSSPPLKYNFAAECINKLTQRLLKENTSWARKTLGETFGMRVKDSLETLTRAYGFSVKCGDLQIINCNWHVTHTGLIGLARRKRCTGIHVEAVISLCDSAVHKSQIPIIEQAIETAALMLGTDKSRGYCLEMICADFLAGAHLDNGNPEMLLNSISRYYRFLPGEQQQIFLDNLREKAS